MTDTATRFGRGMAFVWTRALREQREGQWSLRPAIVQSAAGPVDGVCITGSTFHGRAALKREDATLHLFAHEAREMLAALESTLAVIDAPDPDEVKRQVEALAVQFQHASTDKTIGVLVADDWAVRLATLAYELGARVR